MRPTYCPLFARFISLLMSAALLFSMLVVAPRSSAKSPRKAKSTAPVISPQGNSQRQRQPAPRDNDRRVDPIPPERGAPTTNLPNPEELKRRKPEKPEAPAPIPSTVRSPRKLLLQPPRRTPSSPLPPPIGPSKSAALSSHDPEARVEDLAIRSRNAVRSHHARSTLSLPK